MDLDYSVDRAGGRSVMSVLHASFPYLSQEGSLAHGSTFDKHITSQIQMLRSRALAREGHEARDCRRTSGEPTVELSTPLPNNPNHTRRRQHNIRRHHQTATWPQPRSISH